MDLKAFVKFVGGLLGALGGSAAVFIAFGYITLQSFLSHMKLYGLASFPVQFYKEASITLLRDFAIYYLNHPAAVLIPLGILAPVLLIRVKTGRKAEKPSDQEKPDQHDRRLTVWRRTAGITGLIMIFGVIILPFVAANRGWLELESVIFNALSLPVMLVLFFFLAVDSSKLNFSEPLKNLYSWYVIGFIVLIVSIPVAYGFYLFDIPVFTASVPYCNTEKNPFAIPQGQSAGVETDTDSLHTGGYKLLYLMGHTSEREIFFDATRSPITVILVDKKIINSIPVSYSNIQANTLRVLFSAQRRDLLKGSPEELKRIIPGRAETFTQIQLDNWMTEGEPPQTKEKQDAKK